MDSKILFQKALFLKKTYEVKQMKKIKHLLHVENGFIDLKRDQPEKLGKLQMICK